MMMMMMMMTMSMMMMMMMMVVMMTMMMMMIIVTVIMIMMVVMVMVIMMMMFFRLAQVQNTNGSFPAYHHFSFKLMKINRKKSARYTQTPIVFATLFVNGSVPEVINISTFLIGLNSLAYFS